MQFSIERQATDIDLLLLLLVKQDKARYGSSFDLGGNNDGAALLCLYKFLDARLTPSPCTQYA